MKRPRIRFGAAFLPFADVAGQALPLPRLLRLSLFQMTVGMAAALMIGTLNRVMIVEFHLAAWIVSAMVSVPLLLAPARALIGFKSDQHRSAFGWKRVPFIWFGTLLQFGGLSIMPFALIVLSGDSHGPAFVGPLAAGLAFLLVGAGMHTVQTAGLALATDLAPPETRPRVVGLLCVMLLAGMMAGALGFGAMLARFTEFRLIGVIQEASLLTLVLNGLALWKQEPRRSGIYERYAGSQASLAEAWAAFRAQPQSMRRLVTIGLGTVGLSMQDILLEPYGGQVLHLTVGQTTTLTALLALGGVSGFAFAGYRLARNADPYRIAALGLLFGILAFALVIFAAPLATPALFVVGVGLIGFGAGLFLVGTLADAMSRASLGINGAAMNGLALGAWGAVQAAAAGSAIALGGIIRDAVPYLASPGSPLGSAAAGYGCVYLIEIGLLFITLIALGPLVRQPRTVPSPSAPGLAARPVR